MSQIRDLIYLNYDKELKRVVSYGIEFKEFIESLTKRPNNILVLEGSYGSEFDFTTNCEYCVSDDIEEFIQEDVHNYGNFSWIDFESVEGLEELEPQKIAELFYVSKKWEVINDTYFNKLNNRFIYTSHDDGWINYTFYNDISDFKEILSKVIVDKIFKIYNIQVDIVDRKIVNDLCDLSMNGIAIDLHRLRVEDNNIITIPIYQLGKYKDMDKVYELSRTAEVEVKFELRNTSKWELIEFSQEC